MRGLRFKTAFVRGMGKVVALGLGVALCAAPLLAAASDRQAQVNAALRADPEISSGLLALAIARVISDRCPTIDGRELQGRFFLFDLYRRARTQGFRAAEIEAFVNDRAEKARFREEVRAWFAARGVTEDSPAAAFCALGREEIETRTLAGRFLVERAGSGAAELAE